MKKRFSLRRLCSGLAVLVPLFMFLVYLFTPRPSRHRNPFDFTCTTRDNGPIGCFSKCSPEHLQALLPAVKVGVFTLVFDEPVPKMEMWLRHYIILQEIPAADVYVNHLDCTLPYLVAYYELYKKYKIPLKNIFNVTNGGRHAERGPGSNADFMAYVQVQINIGNEFQNWMRHTESYSHVIYADSDELIMPHPEKYPGGLIEYIHTNINRTVVVTNGFEVAELMEDKVFNWSLIPALRQRTKWYPNFWESKALLSATNTRFEAGFHTSWLLNPITEHDDLYLPYGCRVCCDRDLFLVHTKVVDCKNGTLKCNGDEWKAAPRDKQGCGRCLWHKRLRLPLFDIPQFVRDRI